MSGLPPGAGSGAGPRLELAVRGEGQSPFVTLDDSGRTSRVLLARFVAGQPPLQQVLSFVALKVRRDLPSAAAAGHPGDNGSLADSHAAETVLGSTLPTGLARFNLGLDGAPLTYCRRVKVFFEPPCPRTGAPLRDCRDEAWLADHGLEPYGSSTIRYLKSGEDTVCYTWSLESSQRTKGVSVRHRTELYRDLRHLVHRHSAAIAELPAPLASFPCLTCQHREECHPQGEEQPTPAEDFLVPLSYHEAQILAAEAAPLRYDELCDLLGGLAPQRLQQRIAASDSGRPMLLGALSDPGSHFLHDRRDPQRLALEVLWLKLAAFQQAATAARSYHAVAGVHLGLSPDNLLVKLADRAVPAPLAWRFTVHLADLYAKVEHQVEGLCAGPVPRLARPTPDAWPAYRSPFATLADLTQEVPLRLTLHHLGDRGLAIDALATAARIPDVRPEDLVWIALQTPWPGIGEQPLVGRVETADRSHARFLVELEAHLLPPKDRLGVAVEGRVAFHRRLSPACDQSALGMLLARALLVHDNQDAFQVEESLRGIVETLEAAAPNLGPSELEQRARSEVGRLGPMFGSSAVLYDAELRDLVVEPIPAGLWDRLLMLILQARTVLPGFSHAGHHADTAGDPVGRLVREVAEVQQRLHVELFAAAARDEEIRDVCDEVLAALTRDLVAGDQP